MNKSVYKAHSGRSAFFSKEKDTGASLNEILKWGHWKSKHKIPNYYSKDII